MTTNRFSFQNHSVATNSLEVPERFALKAAPAVTQDAAAAPVEPVALEAVAPNAISVPQYYEAKYAYPLIVWLQPAGCRAPDLKQIMPVLSERNYFGTLSRLAFSIENPLSAFSLGQRQPGASPVPFNWAADIRRDVLHVRRNFHIHSERIYLAGIGAGASAAIQMLLEKPEWFAGAIALDPDLELADVSVRNLTELGGKRLFTTAVMPSAGLSDLERLCFGAGVDVTHKNYPTELSLHRKVLLDVDRWLMSEICQPQMV
jgi:phospholipase/carboxylesterase